jgi:hypothetical protein
MQLRRLVGFVDLGVATVVVVAVLLPAREMFATPAIKGDDVHQFELALAEARTIAQPGDGMATETFERALSEAGMKDWAIETSVHASAESHAPTRWRALLAASVAYVDRLDVVPGLDYANRALTACDAARERGDANACPSWEEIRVQLYQQHLDAGVKSGIDPRHDPVGFRKAGESALRQIHLNSREPKQSGTTNEQRGSATGSGSAGSAGAPSEP